MGRAPREVILRTSDGISATEPDWSRERPARRARRPSHALLAAIRDYQRHAAARGPIAAVARRIAVLRHRFWSGVTGADIPLATRIGGGLLMPHPNGIVIHPDAVIGPNCIIFQQVTIGVARGGIPRVGGHVDLGAGAKVLGGIVLGDHCAVGANAVVTIDVPEGATAIGVPARIIHRPDA